MPPTRKLRPVRTRSRHPKAEALESRTLLAADFQSATLTPINFSPTAQATGDFNGDGRPDLVQTAITRALVPTGFLPSAVVTRLGNGDGTFQDPTFYDQIIPRPDLGGAVSQQPMAVVVGDFTGDGKLDFVVLQNQYAEATSRTERRTIQIGDTFRNIYVTVEIPEVPSTIQVFVGQGDGNFQPQTPTPVTRQPRALAAGDLNGDGKVDLVVDRSVLLGLGNGSFAPATPLEANDTAIANALLLTDVNRDGKLDLVSALANLSRVGATTPTDPVEIRLGRGDGTFVAPVVIQTDALVPLYLLFTNDNTMALTTGDFNGDGNPDLALVAHGLKVLLGRGDGIFTPGQTYSLGEASLNRSPLPSQVVAADFDGDGVLDLAATTQGPIPSLNTATILRGRGDGTFVGPVVEFLSPSVSPAQALGDLNGDGLLDLVYGETFDVPATVAVRLGLAGGGYGPALRPDLLPPTQFLNPVRSLALGDLNGDGLLDLVVTTAGILNYDSAGGGGYSLQGQGSQILMGRGDGSFRAPTQVSQPLVKPDLSQLADVDGDSRLDLVTLYRDYTGATQTGVSVELGQGDGSFGSPVRFELAPSSDPDIFRLSNPYLVGLAIGDLNGDGRPDLAVTDRVTQQVHILLNQGGVGTVAFSSPTQVAPGLHPQTIRLADLNGDGFADLLVANTGVYSDENLPVGANVVLLAGRGDGTFADPQALDAVTTMFPQDLVVADFNGDGQADLAILFQRGGNLPLTIGLLPGEAHILLGGPTASGNFPRTAILPLGDPASTLLAGDVDRDGRVDLLALGTLANTSFGQGDGTFGQAQTVAATAAASGLVVADFNNDGRPDLAAIGSLNFDQNTRVLLNSTRSSRFTLVGQGTGLVSLPGIPIGPTGLASISGADPLDRVSDFVATVDWGDGSNPEFATLQPTGPGTYVVIGGHTYQRPGQFVTTVQVRSLIDGGLVTMTTSVVIFDIATLPPRWNLLPLSGRLDASSDTGASAFDFLTNDNTPTFNGITRPGTTVRVYVRRLDAAGQPGFETLIGDTQAGVDGSWSVTSVSLADGPYEVFAQVNNVEGAPTTLTLARADLPLSIDTTGPRITSVRLDVRNNRIIVTYVDPYAGIDASGGVIDASAYRFRQGVARSQKGFRIAGLSTSVEGTNPDVRTVIISLAGGRLAAGRNYLLRIDGGRITDRAGNALDGEFLDRLPSGNSQPGGNFAARLTLRGGTVARPLAPTVTVAKKLRRAANHPAGPRAAFART